MTPNVCAGIRLRQRGFHNHFFSSSSSAYKDYNRYAKDRDLPFNEMENRVYFFVCSSKLAINSNQPISVLGFVQFLNSDMVSIELNGATDTVARELSMVLN